MVRVAISVEGATEERFSELVLKPYLEQKNIKRCVMWLVKYSYPIFLVHHFVTNQVVKHFDLLMVGKLDSYILFVLCLSIIFPISVLVYRLERMILNVK